MAATSILSSTAALESQCEKVGLSADWVTALKGASVESLSKLSYSVTLPGTPATDSDIDGFAAKLRPGVALALGDAAALKRLVFEAQTLTIADLRSSIQPGEEAQKKLPAAERSLRIENQRKRLVGLPLMKGSWQVAYALYDKFAHMMETEELRFIAPNECITRDAELAGGKPPKSVVIDASKTGLVLKDEESVAQLALTSDHELCQAMVRRALAMNVVGLATFSTSQAWVERLFEVIVLQVQIFIFHRKFSNLHDEKISAFSPGQALTRAGKEFFLWPYVLRKYSVAGRGRWLKPQTWRVFLRRCCYVLPA